MNYQKQKSQLRSLLNEGKKNRFRDTVLRTTIYFFAVGKATRYIRLSNKLIQSSMEHIES